MNVCTLNQVDSFARYNEHSHTWVFFQLLLGSLLFVICSKITIPLYPIPITMQPFGVCLLAIMQGGKRASYSILLYLLLASLGLPVLAGTGSFPFWWLRPSAGYLISFPIAAFVVGKLVDAYPQPSSFYLTSSIVTGQCIIYFFGILGLMRIVHFEQSLAVGCFPFLPIAVIHIVLASLFGKLWLHWTKK